MLKRLFFHIAVRYLERGLFEGPRPQLSQQEFDGLLSQLWQNLAFRTYVADRNGKLIFTLSGGEGMEPEPRDAYLKHSGQRVENLLLASKAKAAYERVSRSHKDKEVLTKED